MVLTPEWLELMVATLEGGPTLAVKVYFHRRNEDSDDTRARTIELTKGQYLTCRLEWCNKAAWALFSKYWTTDEYKRKRESPRVVHEF